MVIKNFDIVLDLKNNKRINIIEVVQGDYETNIFNIEITDNYEPVNLTGTTVEILFAKPDNTTVMQDMESGVVVTDAANGKTTITLNTNTIASPGVVLSELRIKEAGKVVTTARFSFIVRKAIVSNVRSSNEFPVLERLIEDAENYLDVFPEWANQESVRQANEQGRVTAEQERVSAFTTYEPRIAGVETDLLSFKEDYALKTKYFPLIKKEKTRSGTVNTIRPQLYYNNELYLTLGNIIYKTTDVTASLSPIYTFASGISLASLIRTSLGTWLALYTQSGIRKIARSTDLLNWTVVLDNITSGMIASLGWDSGNGKVLYGEYTTDTTTNVPEIKLYRSLDDGLTWSVAKTWTRTGAGSIRHIHCVRYDKYSQKFWIATGDALAESFIYSTSDGSVLTTELSGDESLTAVSLAFDKRYVFWGKDLQTASDFTIHAFNKSTKKVREVGIVNNVVYDIIKHPNGYLMIDQAEDAPQRGAFSNSVYVYFSYDGFAWERVYEIPLNDGDTHYIRNYALSEDGSKLTWMREYKQGASAYQFYIETISLTF